MEQPLIAIVDDEGDIAELIELGLSKAGYKSRWYDTGSLFLKNIQNGKIPALIILDLMLPDMDGFDICKQLRNNKNTAQIPIIMLTAKTDEVDRVLGLELGADDYVTKPFSTKELVARVKAHLRRKNQVEGTKNISLSGLFLDPEKYEVHIEDKTIDLTTTEFKLLHVLTGRPGVVFSREKLLDALWGSEKVVIDRTIDVHVKHIREKLGDYGACIQNIRGVGYKYFPEDTPKSGKSKKA
jgi:DNA-binding response OmpR family regulator